MDGILPDKLRYMPLLHIIFWIVRFLPYVIPCSEELNGSSLFLMLSVEFTLLLIDMKLIVVWPRQL